MGSPWCISLKGLKKIDFDPNEYGNGTNATARHNKVDNVWREIKIVESITYKGPF